jgi:serine/threonine-protein kinase RsbW
MAGVMLRESWLPASPESARLARAIVRDAAEELGVSDRDAWDLMLATTEAFANAVEHGSECGKEGGILLQLERSDDGLCVEVRDCGSFHVSRPPDDLEETRGRGIPLMAAVVDQLELMPGGRQTRVRFRKHVEVA